jgi:hypothetical protein
MQSKKKSHRFRGIALATVLFVFSSSVSCGYFLHPERRGNSSGHIDGVTLILDILWLIPGIIPGVVALAIDFSSGAIYTGGGRRAHKLEKGTKVIVKRPEVLRKTRFELRVIKGPETDGAETDGAGGEVIASARAVFRPGEGGDQKLVLDVEPLRRKLKVAQNGPVRAQLVLLIDGQVFRQAPCVIQ